MVLTSLQEEHAEPQCTWSLGYDMGICLLGKTKTWRNTVRNSEFLPPTSRASAPIWKCSALTLIQSSHLTGWNVGRKSSLQTQGSSSHPGRTVLERGERKCISSFLHLTNNKRNLIIRKHFWKQNLLLLGFQLFHTWWQYLRLTLSPAQVHSHSPAFDT